MNLTNRLLCVALLLVPLAGCETEHQGGGPAPDAVVVAVAGADIAPDGSLSEKGLQKLTAVPADKKIALSVVRSRLTDKALVQLAKYPNLHSIEAIGSPLTQAAITQLKTAVPNVQVSK